MRLIDGIIGFFDILYNLIDVWKEDKFSKYIIVGFKAPYWNEDVRKELMQYIIHNCSGEFLPPEGNVTETKDKYLRLHLSDCNPKIYEIKWN